MIFKILIFAWLVFNIWLTIGLYREGFKFGKKSYFGLKGKSILNILVQFIVLMPVMLVCAMVLLFEFIPFKKDC